MYEQINITMPEGECPAHVFTPEGKGEGPWPAVIFYMDGLAIRQTLFDMAQRLANGGYVVLLPDMFWRAGPYAPLDPKVVCASGNVRGAIAHLFGSTNNALAAQDTGAFLAYLDSRTDVAGSKVGATGYCMGAGMVFYAAGTYPERFAAGAGFHGGNLATDDPASPHLLAPKIKARIYVGGADNDAGYPPEMAERLDRALTEAGVEHTCAFYPGALHGWTMADFPIYDEPAAERHWQVLFELFGATLR